MESTLTDLLSLVQEFYTLVENGIANTEFNDAVMRQHAVNQTFLLYVIAFGVCWIAGLQSIKWVIWIKGFRDFW